MTLSKDDPRLLSYVLGELDEAESREIEAAIDGDPDIRAEIDALRMTAEMLREGLAERAPKALPAKQRKVLEEATRETETPKVMPLRRRFLQPMLLAAAAVALVAIPLGVMVQRRKTLLAAEQAMKDLAAFEAPQKEKEKTTAPPPKDDTKIDEATRREILRMLQEDRARQGGEVAERIPKPRRLTARSKPRADENPFIYTTSIARSTFPLDMDTASYSLVERYIREAARRPTPGLVRVDELVNAFPYEDPPPIGDAPLAVRAEVDAAPWNRSHRLVRLALKTAPFDPSIRPQTNLVFVIDKSPGFAKDPDKLPLLQAALRRLVSRLDERDRLTLLAYGDPSEEPHLPPTPGDDKPRLLTAIDKFEPSVTAPSGDSLARAFKEAQAHFVAGGVNRVFLATDAHFVANSEEGRLTALVREKAATGISLSALGFGPMDGPAGQTLKRLAEEGKGSFAEITSPDDARKELVDEAMGTRTPIARDVRVEVDFDPLYVRSFRLIGNEDRTGPEREFLDAWKGPVDLYAGQGVTALYELEPRPDTSGGSEAPRVPYLLTLRVHYKDMSGQTSQEIEVPLRDEWHRGGSTDFYFAASVAAFGLLLRDSPFKGNLTVADIAAMAKKNLGTDPGGHRARFVNLLELAEFTPGLAPRPQGSAPPRKGCAPGDPLCSEL
ncbi:YfbK domain-containing protein [Polyangium jinanense]|uniref:von Willebrand factor type A domain-containing protein n=1 Tax=Polyangium jinanense TaxID=2829994 RepID=A0A9X4AWC5_9BACT|nr:von Willebrand factor type A domain-containing protein [Polyangium jinanense]MDC3956801.1 von Willebrand factor type A domain-containing protein [Polyangium jinanense]MDC3987203.1 von Willebrand factor type A domain-containing protein [Polyangium jinanense]